MDQPLGFQDHDAGITLCRLCKILYGLKQSSRISNKKFDTFLKNFNLKASLANSCVYVQNSLPKLIITIWVDNGIICSTNFATINSILRFMDGAFHITTGLAELYVGLHIVRDRSRPIPTLNQSKYVEQVLKRFQQK